MKNNKILFVYPGIASIGYDSYDKSLNMSDSDPIYAFSLLASIAQERGFEVSLIDMRQLKNDDELFRRLRSDDSAIVAITVQTPSFDIASRVASIAKGLGKITIGGGIHATVAPEDFETNSAWDYVILGEAELAFPWLLNEISAGNRPDKLISGEILDDLDLLPLPHYFAEWEDRYRLTYSIEIARGCPGRCTYCVSGEKKFFKKMRFRSIDHVMNELDVAYDRFKFNHLLFLDVCASNNPKYFLDLLDRIATKYSHINITTQERVDSFNENIAQLLARFRSSMVWFGFESASDRILKFINKEANPEKGIKAANLCRKYNLKIGANVLIGIPSETEEEIRLTYDYIKRIQPDMLFCNILSPFPGTKINQFCRENGLMPEIESYERYELRNVLEKGFIRNVDYELIRYWHRRFNSLIYNSGSRWKTDFRRFIYENIDRETISRLMRSTLVSHVVDSIFKK